MTQATPTKPKQCAATRKDGRRCAAPAIPGGPFCFAHAPELAEERLAALEAAQEAAPGRRPA